MQYILTEDYKEIVDNYKSLFSDTASEDENQDEVLEEGYRQITREVGMELVRRALENTEDKYCKESLGVVYFMLLDLFGKGEPLSKRLASKIYKLTMDLGVNVLDIDSEDFRRSISSVAKASATRRNVLGPR